MPRYFFHIRDGEYIPDHHGTELPDDEAAKHEAIAASSEALRALGSRFWDGSQWQMIVVDEAEHEVLTLDFSGHLKEA
jgi:hypothetical protein